MDIIFEKNFRCSIHFRTKQTYCYEAFRGSHAYIFLLVRCTMQILLDESILCAERNKKDDAKLI